MSYEVWRGPSELDGVTDTVVLMTGNSKNGKSGDQLQTWIMRADMPPQVAVEQDLDEPICGDCLHRKKRSCYVLTWWGPRAAYNHWVEHGLKLPTYYTYGAHIRFGAYGEITAAPFEVAAKLMTKTRGHTGFTSQWRDCDPRFKSLLMASVTSITEAKEAQALGWRTYRTADRDWHKVKGESLCPGSKEAGKILTCAQCGFCNGNATGLRGNVVIPVHGAPHLQRRFEAGVQPHAPLASMRAPQQEGILTWL